MFTEMQAMLDRNAADLMAGATEAIAERCAYPMVVHSGHRILAFQKPSDYAASLRVIAARLGEAQVGLSVRLRAIDAPRNGRFRAWARLSWRGAGEGAPPETDAVYYCRVTGDAIRVEMLEMDCALLPAAPLSGTAA